MAIQYVLNPWAFISLFAFVVSLVLGLMILKKNPSGRLNRVYALLAFGLSMWAIGETVLRFIPKSAEGTESYAVAVNLARFVWGFVILATFTIMHFTMILIRSKSKILKSKAIIIIMYGGGIAFALVAWFTPLIVSGVKWTWFGYTGERSGNIGYTVYLGVYIFMMLFIAISVVKAIRASKNVIEKSQLKLALLGMMSVLLIGGIGQIVLPVLGKDIPTGTITTIVMGVCFAYDMLKYNLFEIEAVTEAGAPTEARQRLDPGLNYLVEESGSRNAYEIFRGMVTSTPGLCFSTFHPQKLRQDFKLERTPIIWLTETETTERKLSPTRLEFEILYTIESFIRENEATTILIDDIKYLGMTNDFQKTMDFIKSITDLASMNNSSILMPINRVLFKDVEFHQLESAFDEVIDTGLVSEDKIKDDFKIQSSYAYLCESDSADTFYTFIKNSGLPLLCLTKSFPSKIQKKYEMREGDFHWLTDTTSGDAQTLNPKRLDFEPTMVIGEFLRKKSGLVAIDGLDTMIYQNGLDKVTEFLKTIIDIASESKGSVIAHIDPKPYKVEEIALLEKRFDIMIPKGDS